VKPRPVRALIADDDRMTQRLIQAILSARRPTSNIAVEIVAHLCQVQNLATTLLCEAPELLILDRWLGATDTLPMLRTHARRSWLSRCQVLIISADRPPQIPISSRFLSKDALLSSLLDVVQEVFAQSPIAEQTAPRCAFFLRLDGLDSFTDVDLAEAILRTLDARLQSSYGQHCHPLGGVYYALSENPQRFGRLQEVDDWCRQEHPSLSLRCIPASTICP
jgi:hypothetical protein